MGEASASFGFATERLFDELDPLEVESKRMLEARGVKGGRALMKAMAAIDEQAIELLRQERLPKGQRDEAKIAALKADKLVRTPCWIPPRTSCAPASSSGPPAWAPP
jgi:hypothetical protein